MGVPPTLPLLLPVVGERWGGSTSHSPSPSTGSGRRVVWEYLPPHPSPSIGSGRRVVWEYLPPIPLLLPVVGEGWVGVPPTLPLLLPVVGERWGGSTSHSPSPSTGSGRRVVWEYLPPHPSPSTGSGRRVVWEYLPPIPLLLPVVGEGWVGVPPTLPLLLPVVGERWGGITSHSPSPSTGSGRRVVWEYLPPHPSPSTGSGRRVVWEYLPLSLSFYR